MGNPIGDFSILEAETMTILKTVQMAIWMQLSNIIIKSDSQITIQSISGNVKAPSQITNSIKNIIVLANTIRNTQFLIAIE